jgi:hypothetical protein
MSHAEGQGNGGKAAADADPITNSRGGNDLESHLLPEDSAEEQVADEAPLLENRPPTPPTDSLLFVCTVFSIVSALGSVLCMVVNLISLLRSFDYRGFDYRVSVRFRSLSFVPSRPVLNEFAGHFVLYHCFL